MKLEEKKLEIIGSIGEESYEATISQEDLGKMWDMLQNPYKNNIGSIIREITSNCFDSHAEAGITDAVRITYGKDETGLYVNFQDVGVGLSPERVQTIYTRYLKSTKENSNKFIGAFGIGSKSPLSYQDLFYIKTRFNGVEYNYLMRKGESAPVVDLLNKKLTTERNGTEIKVNIKSEADLIKFLKETQSQLQYFTNVDINVDNLKQYYTVGYNYNSSVTHLLENFEVPYKIIEGENFIYKTDNNAFSELHLTIGSVAYPIDWTNLGEVKNNTPVALKFEIGELAVIQTREDIRYTESNIKAIRDKIKALELELTEIKSKQFGIPAKNIMEFVDSKNFTSAQFITFDVDGAKYYLNIDSLLLTDKLPAYQIENFPIQFSSLQESFKAQGALSSIYFSNTNFVYEESVNNSLKNYIKKEKKFTNALRLQTMSLKDIGYLGKISYVNNLFNSIRQIYELKESVEQNVYKYIIVNSNTSYSTKKNKYIALKLYENENIYFVSLTKPKIHLFHLKELYKKNKQLHFLTFRMFVNVMLKEFKDADISNLFLKYDDIKVDEAWWTKYQKDNKKTTDYDKSLMAIERGRLGSDNIYYDKTSVREDLETYMNNKVFTILINKDDKSKFITSTYNSYCLFERFILAYFNIVSKRKDSRFVIDIVSNRNYEKILKQRSENSPIFTLEEFFNNKKIQMRHIGKLLTIIKIKKDISENIIFNTGKTWDQIVSTSFLFSDSLRKDIESLNTDVKTVKKVVYELGETDFNKLFFDDLDNISLDHVLIDKDIVSKYSDILKFLKETNYHLTGGSYSDCLPIIKNYTPSSSRFKFNNVFYKTNVTKDDIAKMYADFRGTSYSDKTVDEIYNYYERDHNIQSRRSINSNIIPNYNYNENNILLALILIYYDYYFVVANSMDYLYDPFVLEKEVEEVELEEVELEVEEVKI